AASLSDGTPSSNVTFTFSEAPVGFDASDLTMAGGTLGPITQDTATTYHATFTATDGISATGSVSVTAGSYTDA
ncbi:Ig-like domain-containing protein, partial [Mesorhizobium sp. 10.2.3]